MAASDRTADRSSGPALRRVHGASVLLALGSLAARWFAPILAVVWLAGREGPSLESLRPILVFAGFAAAAHVASYLTTRYGIVGDRFVLVRGWLFRRERTIPLDRIQNVRVRQGPFLRLLSLAELRIETAGDFAEREVDLTGIPLDTAIELRRRLLRRAAPAERSAAGEPILRLGTGQVLLAGATENRVGYIAAGVAGALELLDEAGVDRRAWIEGILARWVGEPEPVWPWIAVTVLLLLVSGWTVSMGLALLSFHGFTLERTPRGFVRRSGLVQRTWLLLPVERVQAVVIDANPIRRLIRRAAVRAITAGGSREDAKTGRSVVAPLLPEARARGLAALLLGVAPPPDRLLPVHRRAIRRGFVRFTLLSLLPLLALWRAAGAHATLAAAPPLLFLAWSLARLRYRALGWFFDGTLLVARAGIWNRRTFHVPVERVQSAAWRQSPVQRLQGLASLEVDIAGTGPFAGPRIVDLEENEAFSLLEALAARA